MITVPFAVIHIPHSSIIVPDGVRRQYLLDTHELERELLLMTDWYTDELFALPQESAITVWFPVSRLVVDPERFEDDSREPMAERGMGAIYVKTSDGRPLRRPIAPEEREMLIRTYYRPHHERLGMTVVKALSAHGHCMIIDAHSFPSKPLPYEPDQRIDRPAICIGTDDFHTPGWLANCAVGQFRDQFDSVEVNRPYAGALVPVPHFGKDHRVCSIMIEINRALYMDERTGSKSPNYDDNKGKLKRAISQLIDLIGEKTSLRWRSS